MPSAPHHLQLEALAPYRLDLTIWTLRRRAENAVDRWDGRTYRRVLMLPTGPVEVAVRQPDPAAPLLDATIEGPGLSDESLPLALDALDRLLALRADLRDFYQFAARDERLAGLVERFRGWKPPRYLDPFEALVNAIACQQITLTFGIRLLARLTALHAPAWPERGVHAFPRPQDLAGVAPEDLHALGFSRNKTRALLDLAGAVTAGTVDLSQLTVLDDATALARLQLLRGVGSWTAQYVLLRGLGRWHVFPGNDSGARGALGRWLSPTTPLDEATTRRLLEVWHPYAGLVYLHLLLAGIKDL